MAEIKIYLDDQLDERFRGLAMNVYGYGRGSISKAASDALAKWCREHEGAKEALSHGPDATKEGITTMVKEGGPKASALGQDS